MKVTGVLITLAAAAPMVSAVPFKMSDFLAPYARHVPEPAQPAHPGHHFPHYPNITARGYNETSKRSVPFTPQTIVERRTNYTFKG